MFYEYILMYNDMQFVYFYLNFDLIDIYFVYELLQEIAENIFDINNMSYFLI